MKYLVGIDEAGRGPLAGPVAVGAVLVARNFDFKLVEGVRDSKQLTHAARAAWYERMRQMQEDGLLKFAVAFSSARSIDRRGIVPSIRTALSHALDYIEAEPHECEVRLDGSLRAPARFEVQETIIHGDDLEPIISLASIAAKVRRDALMMRLARRYPAYGFDRHKGYGTQEHIGAIRSHGLSELHRVTFCGSLRPQGITV